MKYLTWIVVMFGIIFTGCSSNINLKNNTKHTVILEKYPQGYKVEEKNNNKAEDEIFTINKTLNKPKPKKMPIKPIIATSYSSGYIQAGKDCLRNALIYCHDNAIQENGVVDADSFRICFDTTMAFICSKQGRKDAGFDMFDK